MTTTIPSDKRAYTLEEAAMACGYGVSTIREAIRAGEIAPNYGGPKKSKPTIRVAELDRWLESLPTEKPE